MQINHLLSELASQPYFLIEEGAGTRIAREVRNNMANHTPVAAAVTGTAEGFAPSNTHLLVCKGKDRKSLYASHKTLSPVTLKAHADLFSQQIIVGNALELQRWGEIEADDEVINKVVVRGGITRYGGACSYGSMAIRDEIQYAAKMPQCIAHYIVMDSPGGVVGAIDDFRDAIDSAHEAGQEVWMRIDGTCASAALWVACMCDRVFYTNENNQIGSVGVFGTFYTNKDGDKNTITQEVFHQRYATCSPDKNKAYRDAAEGDMEAIDQEITEAAQEFADTVKALRPDTPDDMLSGKCKPAKECSFWVEGKATEQDIIGMILAKRICGPKN